MDAEPALAVPLMVGLNLWPLNQSVSEDDPGTMPTQQVLTVNL